MIRNILKTLFPPRCVFCKKLTDDEYVCATCISMLPHYNRLIKGGEFYESCGASFYYSGIVRSSMLRYKFSGRRNYALVYADFLAETIRTLYPGDFDVISWVPVSKKRLRKRGYDQAQLLCENTAALMGLPSSPTLSKIINTPAQSGVKGAERRRANVLGAYNVLPDFSPNGKRILLIDDILTTGATLSECARTLLIGGADSVICAVLAYAGR